MSEADKKWQRRDMLKLLRRKGRKHLKLDRLDKSIVTKQECNEGF